MTSEAGAGTMHDFTATRPEPGSWPAAPLSAETRNTACTRLLTQLLHEPRVGDEFVVRGARPDEVEVVRPGGSAVRPGPPMEAPVASLS